MDRQTDRILIARPHLHSIQHGKNRIWITDLIYAHPKFLVDKSQAIYTIRNKYTCCHNTKIRQQQQQLRDFDTYSSSWSTAASDFAAEHRAPDCHCCSYHCHDCHHQAHCSKLETVLATRHTLPWCITYQYQLSPSITGSKYKYCKI